MLLEENESLEITLNFAKLPQFLEAIEKVDARNKAKLGVDEVVEELMKKFISKRCFLQSC